MSSILTHVARPRLSIHSPWFWVVVGFLVAAPRLFESGLSLDPAIYAVAARNVAEKGGWWSLRVGEFFFPQFAEHPYGVFWLQALVFRVFGASDFSVRLLGAVFGSLSFFFLFRLGERLLDRRFAHVLCLLTVLSIPFVGRMATGYLEIPFTFCVLGGWAFFVDASAGGPKRSWALSGLFLAGAFVTKGLATVPAIATLGAFLLLRPYRGRVAEAPRWLGAAGAVALALVLTAFWCAAQQSFGTFPFFERYFGPALFGKALRPATDSYDIISFCRAFLRLHPVHCAFALASAAALRRDRGLREACLFGGAGSLLFLIANGMLGKLHQHYFYPIFPIVNVLAAATVFHWMPKAAEEAPRRWVLYAAVFLMILWNVIPASSRRKPSIDFFQLEGNFATLRDRGVQRIDGVGIQELDWVYPAMSLWYWRVDTRPVAVTKVDSEVVLSEERTADPILESRGYRLCAATPRYRLYVANTALLQRCRDSAFPARRLR